MRHLNFFFPIALLLCGGCTSQGPLVKVSDGQLMQRRAGAYEHFVRGQIDLEYGRHADALTHYKIAIAEAPDEPELYAAAAQAHLFLGQVEEARLAVDRAERLDGEHGHVSLVHARLLAEEGRYLEAGRMADAAIAQDPGLVEAYFDAVTYYRKVERTADAERVLRQHLSLNPLSARAHDMLARFAHERADYEVAAEHWEELVDLRPRSAAGYRKLVVAYRKGESFDAALDAAVRCTANVIDGSACWADRLHLVARGRQVSDPVPQRLTEELRLMADALAHHPELVSAYAAKFMNQGDAPLLHAFAEAVAEHGHAHTFYYLGLLHSRNDVKQEAIAAYSRVPASSAFYVESSGKAAILLSEDGRHNDAVSILKTAIQAQPTLVELRTLQAAILERGARSEEALKVLQAAAQLDPDRVDTHYKIALLAWSMGRSELAITALEAVLHHEPEHVASLNFLGYALAELDRDLPRAERLVEQAVKLRGVPDGALLDSLGRIYFKQGQTVEAIRVLEEARSLLPKEAEVLAHLADAYHADGQALRALELYQQAFHLARRPSVRALVSDKIKLVSMRR